MTHPLIVFSDRWTLDGDHICCRGCDGSQHITRGATDFPHRALCENAARRQRPWVELHDLIEDALRLTGLV